MRIAIHAFPGVTMFHLSVPQMVFDEVARQGLAEWETQVFAERAGPVRTAEGLTVGGARGLRAMEEADLIVLPSWHEDGRETSARLTAALARAHRRGAVVVGLCLGAIPVADAGLLAGRRAVTHWQASDLLASRHPDVELDQQVLYVDHGDVLTSAGTASGLDACLHVVRRRLGADAANRVARSLVIAPHREGGQAQFIDRPLPARSAEGPIAGVLEWALQHLGEPLRVDDLARRAQQSRRTFLRAFRATTGTTPAAWLRAQQLDAARRMLESSDAPIERVAAECGFGSVVTFRQAFAAAFGTTPSSYRRRFDARRA
ncbi:GlxA family transcriptional regulator [Agrococcus sp. Marseille-P2731]|uniref:GlxA family transcriptional regulator n=1 Tax=Agrococcus sp. Marseille-P2731 TaxID=1841862 RepID=UPI000A664B4B|nr:helix-turn-helix domain-containing protein [Agrococcus sp. Marseille-P2731]